MITLLLLGSVVAATCDSGYRSHTSIGSLSSGLVTESSGVAFSRTRSGVWFTHNDSGGKAELYAFKLDGTFVETHSVTGGGFRDWEDLSAGPCPGDPADSCIFIGDFGDNASARSSVQIYVVKEPASGASAPVVASWDVTWPGGARDAESLFVHPLTGQVYIASKRSDGYTDIAKLPETPGSGTLDIITTLNLTALGSGSLTTGADWEEEGDRLVIRTYGNLLEWITDPCDPDAHWGDTPTRHWLTDSQGEAIAYGPDGHLYTTSEGYPMDIGLVECRSFGEGAGPCEDDEDTGLPPDEDTGLPPDEDTGLPPDEDTGLPPDDGGSGGCNPDDWSYGPYSGSAWGCSSLGLQSKGLAALVMLAIPVLARRRRGPVS